MKGGIIHLTDGLFHSIFSFICFIIGYLGFETKDSGL